MRRSWASHIALISYIAVICNACSAVKSETELPPEENKNNMLSHHQKREISVEYVVATANIDTTESRLVGSSTVTNDYFGYSVALFNGTLVCGVPYYNAGGSADAGICLHALFCYMNTDLPCMD